MFRPLRLAKNQNPLPQHNAQFSNRLLTEPSTLRDEKRSACFVR